MYIHWVNMWHEDFQQLQPNTKKYYPVSQGAEAEAHITVTQLEVSITFYKLQPINYTNIK